MSKILREFNTVKDKLYFHHSLTPRLELPKVHGPESHNRFELLYLISGHVDYVIEGERYSVSDGDCIFVAPNEIHKLFIENTFDYERKVLVFDPSVLKSVLNDNYQQFTEFLYAKSNDFRVIPKAVIENSKIPQLLAEAESLEQSPERNSLFLVSKILLIILELDKILSNASSSVTDCADPLIKQIVEFINQNLTTPLTLEGISAQFFISKSTLSHKFKAHMDRSVKNYISIKKIHYASELIKNGMSATDCAKLLGYEHYTTFFSSYKKIIGKMPSTIKTKQSSKK